MSQCKAHLCIILPRVVQCISFVAGQRTFLCIVYGQRKQKKKTGLCCVFAFTGHREEGREGRKVISEVLCLLETEQNQETSTQRKQRQEERMTKQKGKVHDVLCVCVWVGVSYLVHRAPLYNEQTTNTHMETYIYTHYTYQFSVIFTSSVANFNFLVHLFCCQRHSLALLVLSLLFFPFVSSRISPICLTSAFPSLLLFSLHFLTLFRSVLIYAQFCFGYVKLLMVCLFIYLSIYLFTAVRHWQ